MVVRTGLLNNSLRELPDSELLSGNKICEVTSGWPHAGSVFVLLKRRFSKTYQEDTLQYSEINDPHYWFAQYHTKEEPLHSLYAQWEVENSDALTIRFCGRLIDHQQTTTPYNLNSYKSIT